MSNRDLVSLVIPTFDSAYALKRNLPYLKKNIEKSNYNFEVIVVDDGSSNPEETKSIVDSLGYQIIRLPENLGKGAALRAGFEKATGQYIVFTDADIPYEFKNIEDVLNGLIINQYDLVIGDRTDKSSYYYEGITLKRLFSSKVFISLTRQLGINYVDSQCGLKGFKAPIGKYIFSETQINRLAIDVEVLFIAQLKGFRILQIPVQLRSLDGRSIRLIKDSSQMIVDVLKLTLKKKEFELRYKPQPKQS